VSEERSLPALANAAVVLCGALAWEASAADIQRGANVWSGQCAMCHDIGHGAGHGVGPHLNDILGRPLGGLEDFAGYSGPMVLEGIHGAVWDEALLRAFLRDPYVMMPDTRMLFGGLHVQEDLDNLIAWLLPASRGELPPVEGFRVSATVLALEGDFEYGEYLAAECTTCHRRDGGDDGIPAITGWPESGFVAVMHAYRARVRPNVTMQTISARLGDEEIAALAAYFASLERPVP
jgi:cytochrome c